MLRCQTLSIHSVKSDISDAALLSALWASPKARARARTDEWLEAIARSPSRMMESTGPDSKTHTPTGRLRAKTFEDFLSFQPDDTNASILQQPSLIAESQQNQVAKKPGKLPVEMALMAGPIVSLAGPTQSERVAGGRGQVEDLRPRMEVLERGLDDLRKSQGDTFREMRRFDHPQYIVVSLNGCPCVCVNECHLIRISGQRHLMR